MRQKLKTNFPSWWDNDESYSKSRVLEDSHQFDNDDIFDIEFRKKETKTNDFSKKKSRTIKELSNLLVCKDSHVEELEQKLSNLKLVLSSTKSEAEYFKSEYHRLYSEVSLLNDIIKRLDVNGSKKKDNHLFLSEKAPKEVVDAVWKCLSKLYHPDAGGSEERMKLINLERDNFYRERNWK